jgi:hypothetical protein
MKIYFNAPTYETFPSILSRHSKGFTTLVFSEKEIHDSWPGRAFDIKVEDRGNSFEDKSVWQQTKYRCP